MSGLNRYKNMIVLSESEPEKLLAQIKSFYQAFDIMALYGVNGRHYAWINIDRPVVITKKKKQEVDLGVLAIEEKLNN